ncbi:MAG: YaeQ family protein [Myxococcales bacterium]|nr:YaeQ family protein [Myxococcales bacterium]
MAQGATIHRFHVELSDVGRGVYESLDIRVARHASEDERFMLARVLAYALEYEEGIEHARGPWLPEEPALWVRNLRGEVQTWIEVGQPSAERLHKAAKNAPRVAVYMQREPSPWLRDLAKATIHRRDELELWELPSSLLDGLENDLGRQERWTLTVTEGTLFLTRGEETLEGALARHELGSY